MPHISMRSACKQRNPRCSPFVRNRATGESSPFSNGVPSRGGRGLHRFVRLVNPTLASTGTCAQEHGEDAKGHQVSAFSHTMQTPGDECARRGCVVAVRVPYSALPYGSFECGICFAAVLSTDSSGTSTPHLQALKSGAPVQIG